MKRLLATLICTVVLTGRVNAAEEPYRCAEDKHLVGACFKVHGRLQRWANSRLHLWPVGTNRMLGVQYPGNMPEVGGEFVPLPGNLESLVDAGQDVFADYTVCPFSQSEPGLKQYVCIDSFEHVVARSNANHQK